MGTLAKLSPDNDSVRYLLCVIDSYTRFAWVFPLKDKRAATVAAVFDKLLSSLKLAEEPRILTDK